MSRCKTIRFNSYKVIIDEGLPSTIVVVTFDAWNPDKVNRDFFNDIDIGRCYLARRGIKRVHVSTSSNCWYQKPEMKEVLLLLHSIRSEASVMLLYGNSMGGYAAFQYSTQLQADYFLATSPQSSISKKVFNSFSDHRWEQDRNKWYQLNPSYGEESDIVRQSSSGLVLFDPFHPFDTKHALAIANQTNCRLIECPGTWHHSGISLNRVYSIGDTLLDLANLGKDKTVDLIASKIQKKISSGFAANFMSQTWKERYTTLESSDWNLFRRSLKVEVIIEQFRKQITPESILVILIVGKVFDCQKFILNTLRETDSVALAKILLGFSIGFFDIYRKSYIFDYRFIIGYKLLRDEGLRLEQKQNIEGALFLMNIANEIHPKGDFIKAKVEQYQKLILNNKTLE